MMVAILKLVMPCCFSISATLSAALWGFSPPELVMMRMLFLWAMGMRNLARVSMSRA